MEKPPRRLIENPEAVKGFTDVRTSIRHRLRRRCRLHRRADSGCPAVRMEGKNNCTIWVVSTGFLPICRIARALVKMYWRRRQLSALCFWFAYPSFFLVTVSWTPSLFCPLKFTREVNDFIWFDGIHLSEVKGQNHVASPWLAGLVPTTLWQINVHLPSDVFVYLSGPARQTDRTGSKTIPTFSCLFLSAHRKKKIRSVLKVMKSGDSSGRNVTASLS